jgi:hypothetical protein
MSRRLAGIVVVILALVAVIVVPSINGRRLAGSAVASKFPDPPRVGDCLRQPVPSSANRGGVPPEIAFTAISFGPCSGVVAGQIVAFWPSRAAMEADQSTRRSSRGPCYRQAARFAGLPPFQRSTDAFGAPSDGSIAWRPTIGFDPYHVIPGVRESNAGRSWIACLVVPSGHRAYVGTLRDALTTGVMPPQFGSCWAGVELDKVPASLPCDRPHTAELLATGFIRNESIATAAVVDESCRYIAGRIMRVDDPTHGGKLAVVAGGILGTPLILPETPSSIGCFVTTAGGQQLSTTLMGLDDRPVPFVA